MSNQLSRKRKMSDSEIYSTPSKRPRLVSGDDELEDNNNKATEQNCDNNNKATEENREIKKLEYMGRLEKYCKVPVYAFIISIIQLVSNGALDCW